MKKPKKTNTALNTKNSKILHDTMVSLGALKETQSALQEMHINEIQVHLLDKEGDGVILCLEYDESSGELNKTFTTSEEYYEDDENDEELNEVLDACTSPENVKTRIEETISEEYDEIFQDRDSDDKPPLLN